MAITILFVGSVLVGALSGGFYGFCAAGQHAATRGEVFSNNRLLRLMTMPTDNLSVGQAIALLFSVACSLLVFFGAMFTPALLMSWLSVPTSPELEIAYLALFCASFVGWHAGKRLWRVVS